MVLGAVIAPICLLGGPILIRAAWYTAGMVGGLSTVAATAPSDKFLYMGGPLAMGFGLIFAASIASGFMNPVSPFLLALRSSSHPADLGSNPGFADIFFTLLLSLCVESKPI